MKPCRALERDEAGLAQHEPEGLGRTDLLTQVVARANMVRAWKRVKANRGSAGVDGLTIEATIEYLKTEWPRGRTWGRYSYRTVVGPAKAGLFKEGDVGAKLNS